MGLRSIFLGTAASCAFTASALAEPIVLVIEAEVTSVFDVNDDIPALNDVFDQDVFVPRMDMMPGTRIVYAGVFDSSIPAPADGGSIIADSGNQGFAVLAAPPGDSGAFFAASGVGAGALFAQNANDGDGGVFDELVVAKFDVDTFFDEDITDTILQTSGPVGGQPLIGFGFGFDDVSDTPMLINPGDTLNDVFQRIADDDSILPSGSFEIEFGTPATINDMPDFDPYFNISSDILSFDVIDGMDIPDLEDILNGDNGGGNGGGGQLPTVADILQDFADDGTLPTQEIAGIFELPDTIDEFGGFLFDGVPVTEVDPILFDPEIAIGYDYEITGGTPDTFFASVLIPTLMGDDMFTISPFVDGMFLDPIDLMADSEFDLTGFGDITLFRIEGIDPALELDPADAFAFPTLLTFTQSGIIDLSQTPLTTEIDDMGNGGNGGADGGATDIPEPASLALFGFGAAALLRRRRILPCRT